MNHVHCDYICHDSYRIYKYYPVRGSWAAGWSDSDRGYTEPCQFTSRHFLHDDNMLPEGKIRAVVNTHDDSCKTQLREVHWRGITHKSQAIVHTNLSVISYILTRRACNALIHRYPHHGNDILQCGHGAFNSRNDCCWSTREVLDYY